MHCASACVCVCPCICVYVLISQPPRPPPPPDGRQRSERPAPHVIPGQPPHLLCLLVNSSVREQSARDPWLRGVDLYPSPPNPAPPLPIAPAIHMQATHHPPILSSHLSTPGQAVVSRLKFKSSDRPGRAGPRQATTDQTWQAAGTGVGGGTSVWLLIFQQGSDRSGQTAFWGWAGVTHRGQPPSSGD